MQADKIDEIIRLVLTNRASKEDVAYLNMWLAASEENRKVFHHLQLIWQQRATEPLVKDSHQVGERIWKEGIEDKQISLRPSKPAYHFHYLVKIAALLLLILSLPLLVFMYNKQAENLPPVAISLVEKQAPIGKKLKVLLPDGSLVWLNGESKISFAEGLQGKQRVIELEGEAYFEVSKDPTKPFVVKSGKLATTAIGTAFNITSYPEDSTVQVALLSGKVKVTPTDNAPQKEVYFLEAGKGIAYYKNSHEARSYEFDGLQVRAWKEGILIFDGDSFEQVQHKLRRWYGVEITVSGTAPKDWKLTGSFKNEYLSSVLENIRFARSFTYHITGNQLEFKFQTSKKKPMT